jgi:hypothetical protein
MLILTGHLDGEVGRVARSDVAKAVKSFQASLGAQPATGALSAQQFGALQNEFRIAQRKWQFQKVADPLAAELWLPRKVLPDSVSLSFGRRYESDDEDFSVDVAQFSMPAWSLERLRDSPCCKAAVLGKFEDFIATSSDAGMPGFMLSAFDGKKRTSVRAFQRDNVIRLFSIKYNVARDKEFRFLRNAIASSYVPFGSAARTDRVASCASEEPDRVSCNEKPDRNVSPRIVHEP